MHYFILGLSSDRFKDVKKVVLFFGLNIFISISYHMYIYNTTCKFLALERKHIAYLVLLLLYNLLVLSFLFLSSAKRYIV